MGNNEPIPLLHSLASMPLSQAHHGVSPPEVNIPKVYNAAADLLLRHGARADKAAYIDAHTQTRLNYAQLNQQAGLPVYALGGQSADTLAQAQSVGGHGFAGLRRWIT